MTGGQESEEPYELDSGDELEDLYRSDSGPHDPDLWRSLDELERLELVLDAHSQLDENHAVPENLRLHATLHVVVENQLLLDDEVGEAARATLRRFVDAGFERHEAVHAVGSVVAHHIFGVLRGEGEVRADDYLKDLREFTPKQWRTTSTTDLSGAPSKSRGSKRRARPRKRRR